MRTTRLLLIFLVLAATAGCSLLPKQIDETKHWSARHIYTEAKANLNDGNYQQAINYFEKLEARYPFGRYAQQAELEVAYAYYKSGEPDSAVAAADRFIKLHPRNPHVDYAYYLKGLINFNRSPNFLEKLFPQDRSLRDTGSTRQAFLDFRTLVTKFPKSRYAHDAYQRMLYLRNTLAKHELGVARYYMRRGAYVAAVNRCKYILTHYERSPSVAPALFIMAEGYDKLKLPKLAKDARRVLHKTYPNYRVASKKSGWWPF